MEYQNYDYVDFTEVRYTELLHKAKKRPIISYEDINWNQDFLLWRHDVDFSLQRALALAKIESSLDVVSTYFILLRGEYYNPLENKQAGIIQEIISLGHKIGIHFDLSTYQIGNVCDLTNTLECEKYIFKNVLGSEPVAFSFHNPDSNTQKYKAESYAGLINCYSNTFHSIGYGSDSNGYWRHNSLFSLLDDNEIKQIQVLTHPVWWQKSLLEPRDRIVRSVFGRCINQINEYDLALNLAGRDNISLISNVRYQLRKLISQEDLFYIDILWSQGAYSKLEVFLRNVLFQSIDGSRLENKELHQMEIIELLQTFTHRNE